MRTFCRVREVRGTPGRLLVVADLAEHGAAHILIDHVGAAAVLVLADLAEQQPHQAHPPNRGSFNAARDIKAFLLPSLREGR